jgi:hypothetical protein
MKQSQVLHSSIAIAPQSLASNTTTTARIDCAGADYVTLRIQFGAKLNTNATGPTIALTASDDTVVTNFATFNASFARSAEDCTSAKVVTYHVQPPKRYLRVALTTPNSSNDVISACVLAELVKEISPIGTTGQGDVVVIG